MKNNITAQRLAYALSQAHLKPQELANASGVSKSSISQYLSGSHAPSNISSGKMAKVLCVSPVWLMGFDVPMVAEQDDKKQLIPPAPTFTLTTLEKQIITEYRSADEITQEMVLRVLSIDNSSCKGKEERMA